MNQDLTSKPVGRTRAIKQLLPLILEVLVPVAIYYILHAAGVNDIIALTAGSIVPAVFIGYTFIKERKLDKAGLFVLTMFIIGIVLLFVTGDARLVLAKPSAFVFVAALFCFISLARHPFMIAIARPMATDGDPKLEKLWDSSWHTSPEFRRALRASTFVFGAALLIDAVGRAFIAYDFPIDKAVAYAQIPGAIALILAVVYHLKRVKPVFERIKNQAV